MFLGAPKTGGGERTREKMLSAVTSRDFSSPSGCLWTQGLYRHPGSFTYNCPGLLEDDLGIPCLGECRVASGTWERGRGAGRDWGLPAVKSRAFLIAWWDFRVQVSYITITMYSRSRKRKSIPWQALSVTRICCDEQRTGKWGQKWGRVRTSHKSLGLCGLKSKANRKTMFTTFWRWDSCGKVISNPIGH